MGPAKTSQRLRLCYKTHWPAPALTAGIQDDWCIVKNPQNKLILNCPAGKFPKQFSSHGHNDISSFVWLHQGNAILIDTGRVTYMKDPQAIKQKSAFGHNVAMVNGFAPLAESLVLNGNWWPTPYASATVAITQPEQAMVMISHNGFSRGTPVKQHERTLLLQATELHVIDEFVGVGVCEIEFFWQLAPGFITQPNGGFSNQKFDLEIAINQMPAHCQAKASQCSNQYGVTEPHTVIYTKRSVELPARCNNCFQGAAMCGIAGTLRFDGAEVTYAQMALIVAKIAHRGRDHSAILLGSNRAGAQEPITRQANIGLGHRRLSILDLQDAAAQPMFYADNQLCLTYNGEIYNYLTLRKLLEQKSYTFKTNTDSEVLLAAYHYWGESCVNYFNGMFAFAIWDDKNKKLFCARDAVGIKPFYYMHNSQYFAFASESLALAHLNSGNLNHAGISAYFLSMYVATNESIFADIKKLPAGHSMTLQLDGTLTLSRFWSVKQFEGATTSASTLNELNDVITHAVKQQLQSDVPVGGFLSGGVDSGLITALAAPQLSTYYTYSVGYEGMPSNELAAAKAIAQRYQTRHTEVTLRAADAMSILDNALNHLSEPIADPAIVATYHLAELAGADGVKVLLNGTGGDEIFGGYTRYSGQLSLKRKLLAMLPLTLKKSLAALPLNLKLKRRLQQPAFDMLFSTGGSYTLARELMSGSIFSNFLAQLGEEFSALGNIHVPLLYQQMLFDMQVYLPDQLLYLLDQMTMAHTIEGRVPLLDVDIINMAFNFIAKEHMRGGQTKVILKKIAEAYLGSEHIQRKKQGFAGSPSWWVQHNLKQFKEGIAQLKNMPFFDEFNIDLFLALTTPTEKQANEIFMLYCYSKWHSRTQAVLAFR